MKRLRFALLQAAHGNENTTRNFRRELDADLVEFDVNNGEFPRSTDGFDAVVVTGSRASVYWDEPWIDPLVEFVADAADAGLPVLGVCYGHQVVAEALGGQVAGMDDFELGYSEIDRVGDDPLFEGINEQFTVFTSHGDSVVELPPGAELLAENEYGVHAFQKGDCWGVQFHPEYDMETARDIANDKREQVGDDGVNAVLADITPERFAAACEAKQLFGNFTQYVRQQAAEQRDERGAESQPEASA
ncbi:type 1 glutamine amidotransferase [Halonotius terrestris]|uniref:Type 1 glutamine amidotransferase n=1 Tax=Halonotius terrestris TaxID=2487750 RepID=A0A8J8TD56_9EURY|nr:type 1 glutamine amidotransferase [Halonotius terrestris]TQQ82864.1 type 1 glutamine amidotransferase [Halonotius terrestris]